MKESHALQVGVRELKNRLTAYLRLAKADHEVIITERGKPIAVIQSLGLKNLRSLDARLAAMATAGEIRLPRVRLAPRLRRVKLQGPRLSEEIVADRR